MRYLESKKKLDKIRSYNEMMFRMAISHLTCKDRPHTLACLY